MNILFIGAPGSGKGTQARLLSEKYDFVQLSTGDLLRKAIASNSDVGLQAKKFMDQGMLVPDDVMISLVQSWILTQKNKSIIFDGFPRTVAQAQALSSVLLNQSLKMDFVIYFKVDQSDLVTRLTGRRTCKSCGEIYHIEFKKPKVDGVCDLCSGVLVQRTDDREDVITERLHQFEKNTEPTIQYYRNLGALYELDSSSAAEIVFDSIIKKLNLGKIG